MDDCCPECEGTNGTYFAGCESSMDGPAEPSMIVCDDCGHEIEVSKRPRFLRSEDDYDDYYPYSY